MREELGNRRLRLLRWQGGVSPEGPAWPNWIPLNRQKCSPFGPVLTKTSGIAISEIRKHYAQPILGGVDEIDYRKLTTSDIRRQWTETRKQAGAKYIAAPGCSVPNDSTPDELARWNQLPAEEQLARLRAAIQRGIDSGLANVTMGETWLRIRARHPDAKLLA